MAVWSDVKRTKIIETNRIDAEFYKPEYLEIEEKIKKLSYKRFGEVISLLTDYHANGSYESLKNHVKLLENKDYAYMVRTSDLVADNYENNVKYVDKHAYNYLAKSKVFGYEILINKIGSRAGKVYLMPKLDQPVTLGMNLFLVRTINEYSTFFTYAYFCSNIGRRFMERYVNGAAPSTITKDSVRAILVPIPPKNIYETVSKLVSDSMELSKNSKLIYKNAQMYLEKELNLDKLRLYKTRSYESSFSELIKKGRMDADYYQTHYRMHEEHIKKLSTKRLSQIVNFEKGIEVGSNNYVSEGKLFIRVSNVKENDIVTGDSDKYISQALYERVKALKPNIGDILLTKDGTLGVCYVVDKEVEGIISGGIIKMQIKDDIIPAEYLGLVINSIACSYQIERVCSGALILHWKPRDIANLEIPILDKSIMRELAESVIKAKRLKRKSEKLLAQAIRIIEDFIE